MGYDYLVLGAGMQGAAAAYDLARFGEAELVRLADLDPARAAEAAARVNRLTEGDLAEGGQIDVGDRAALARALQGVDVVLSAVPYRFNLLITEAAIAARAGMCDLGGNTGIVLEQLKLDPQARAAGVTVIPDCGLAPGMVNTLAVYAMSKMENPQEVRIWCGGLPRYPKPPLGYKLVFSIEGLTNEYFGKAEVLRDGKVVELDTFTELEELEFPPPVGRCEAFITSGGTSTCPWTFAGKLRRYEYKTVRYPGHYEKIKLLRDLGFLDPEPVKLGAVELAPRELFHKLVPPRISFPEDPDLVVLRVACSGLDRGEPIEVQLELMEFADESAGFSAMERTTAFPAAIVAEMIARGDLERGVIPLERAVPPGPFIAELTKRGFRLTETVRRPLR
ncbi:MAG: saccharopine dehydrogenase NADP-binding domain-containing protein [Candidatus Acetothermia bacterium]|jgi:lysine 6-dehydrogenase|nr:saccharopine dehydrogenase NADP-binding domain-containing protein [Candidatus Acetothermia bacterium]MDH7505276.1 saccharopine dehydrogenase C-terminal domain-containing protein [Candidatus Acetothermia bacterium]